jgi:hypothetical protein
VFIVHCFCGEIMFAAVMTFICNSVPNELLGSVNGLSTRCTLVSRINVPNVNLLSFRSIVGRASPWRWPIHWG